MSKAANIDLGEEMAPDEVVAALQAEAQAAWGRGERRTMTLLTDALAAPPVPAEE